MKVNIERVSPDKSIQKIDIVEIENDLPVEGIMKLAEKGKSFDFLKNKKENIYTI